ncbi:MAG: TfuA-like protein [Bauldia sp.]
MSKAVLAGASVIGLVDGVFENVASVWHKEILYALSEGVQVFGAASMGALRAADVRTLWHGGRRDDLRGPTPRVTSSMTMRWRRCMGRRNSTTSRCPNRW